MGNRFGVIRIITSFFVFVVMGNCFGMEKNPLPKGGVRPSTTNPGYTRTIVHVPANPTPVEYLAGATQGYGETLMQKQLKQKQGPVTAEMLASVRLKPGLGIQSSISKSAAPKDISLQEKKINFQTKEPVSVERKVRSLTEETRSSAQTQAKNLKKIPATPDRDKTLKYNQSLLDEVDKKVVKKIEALQPKIIEETKAPKKQIVTITEEIIAQPKIYKGVQIKEPILKQVAITEKPQSSRAAVISEAPGTTPSRPGVIPPVPTRSAPKPPVEEPSGKQTPPPLPTRPAPPKKVQEEVEKPVATATVKLTAAEAKAAADKARNKKIAAGVAIGAGAAAITGLAVGLGVGLSQDDKQQQAPVPVVGPSDMTTNIVVSPTIEIPTDSGGGSSVVTSVTAPSGVPSVVAPTPTVPVAAPSVAPTETQSATSSTVVVPVAVGKKDEKEEEPKLEEKEPQEAGLIPPPVVEEQEELKQETPKEEEKPAIVPVVVITKEKKEEEPLEVPKKEEKVVVVQKIEERQPVKIEEKQPEKISKKEEFLDEEELIAEERSQEEKEAQLPDEEQKSEVKQTGTVVTPVVISKKTRVTKTRTEVKEHEEKRRAREREEKRRAQERQEKKRRTEREKKKHVKKREEKKRGHEREEKVRPRERKEKEPARKRGEKGKLGKNPIIGSQTQV